MFLDVTAIDTVVLKFLVTESTMEGSEAFCSAFGFWFGLFHVLPLQNVCLCFIPLFPVLYCIQTNCK